MLADTFLEALRQGRVESGGFQDGRVVAVPATQTLYLIGDLHARVSRIGTIVAHAGLEQSLAAREAVLVFLGDLFHPEDDDRAGEMESSLETLRVFMDLKLRFPRHVYALLGNHEFTRSGSCKRGYFQGELFHRALEAAGLAACYEEFLRLSPLVVIHPRCVGVHAGPTRSVGSLEELKRLKVLNTVPTAMASGVMELCFFRHVNWAGNTNKTYSDHDVEDFLALCGVPHARLITGHTPLDRETGWTWNLGPRTTVIFAAGREAGYFRATADSEQFVRVGRSRGGDELVPDRGFGEGVRVLTLPASLRVDVAYALDYPGRPIRLLRDGEPMLRVCQYRHLPPALQSYCGPGTFLVGCESRMEVVRLRRHAAVVLGGTPLCGGVRFAWPEEELAILQMSEEGSLELRALIDGLSLQA